MPTDRTLWSSTAERDAFRRLVFWNGNGQYDSGPVGGTGWFNSHQAFAQWRRGRRNPKGTHTTMVRFLQKWTNEGMMERVECNFKFSPGPMYLYRWID